MTSTRALLRRLVSFRPHAAALALAAILAACSGDVAPDDGVASGGSQGTVAATGTPSAATGAGATSSATGAATTGTGIHPNLGEPVRPLTITMPREAGTFPEPNVPDEPAFPTEHRMLAAYPGIPYVVRAAVVGGHFPYVYSLESAPAGMTVDAGSGEIVWPAPDATAAGVRLRVTDASGARSETTWTIQVDAGRFVFVAAGAAPGGNGTIDAPYARLSSIPEGVHGGKILYLRAGTYDVLDMPRDDEGGAWERVEWNGDVRPVAWLAYPGETPVIDFGSDGAGSAVPFIRMWGQNVYVEGLETTGSRIMAFQLGTSDYAVFRKNDMHTHGPGIEGSNAAWIMTIRGFGIPSHHMAFQDNVFHGAVDSAFLKLYATVSTLVESNVFHDEPNPTEGGDGECVALKDSVSTFVVRDNVFHDLGDRIRAIGGNMNHDELVTSGEILFNLVRAGALDTVDINQDGVAGPIAIYRNTFAGRARVRNTDAADGPFTFAHNVLVNDEPTGVFLESVDDPSRIAVDDNLVGTPDDGILDADGLLTDAYVAYRGTHGRE